MTHFNAFTSVNSWICIVVLSLSLSNSTRASTAGKMSYASLSTTEMGAELGAVGVGAEFSGGSLSADEDVLASTLSSISSFFSFAFCCEMTADKY